ncbi:DUF4333 domain-containing protein [Pseudonocardia sp. ICBG601]|uniref:DUF4333 domain-containing protein n=1 Tax=Pseudonocardia sp. ICBG601 TaxID=2846759 RepID=UPI001CF6DB9C|nr:DUF4333 domain-containing protein [Pseudonocardia sp. ICBG601]
MVFSAAVWPGWAVTVVLEQEALQAGVRTVLIENYELTVTADVQCPAGVAIIPGSGSRARPRSTAKRPR